MKTKTCLNFLLALGGLLFSLQSMATCTTSNQYYSYATLRGVSFSAGADFPVSGLIYKQIISGLTGVNFNCTEGNANFVLSVSGGTPVPGMSNTYESGIPGVGVKITGLNGDVEPVTVTHDAPSGAISASNLSFAVIAVKTGPITAGTANGAILPQVKWDVVDNSGVKSRLAYSSWNSGGFILTTPSCTTPDYTYDLGQTVISNSITSSSWVSTPVILNGCSAFYGNSSDGNSYQSSRQSITEGQVVGLGFAQIGTTAKNIVTMTLTPQVTAIDPVNGILANTPAIENAEGVGVQIAQVSGTTYTPLNLTDSLLVNPDLNSSSNITFPLAARIIKTAEVVKPGKVITAVTYTITYQ